MPELPEVETVMQGLKPALENRRIIGVTLRRDNLRFPFPKDFAGRLSGRRILALRRRAKYILGDVEGGETLLIHLGMTGRFTVVGADSRARNLGEFYFEDGSSGAADGKHDHVVFDMEGGSRVIYSDPRRFGVMDLIAAGAVDDHKLLHGIGVEPLGNELNADYLAARFKGKQAPLKAALLDQRLIAGLGNIYVCEALHRAHLSPKRKAGTLARGKTPDPRLEELVRHIRAVLAEAIAAGGSTLNDFAHTDGTEGGFQQRFAVYDREGQPCSNCGAPVRRIVQAGRSTFYCPACQK